MSRLSASTHYAIRLHLDYLRQELQGNRRPTPARHMDYAQNRPQESRSPSGRKRIQRFAVGEAMTERECEVTIYRIQDKDGRGPWKPGFSKKWVEVREDHDNLPSWFFEFGPVHKTAFTWESVGSGCLTIDQLRRWFTESEYKTLLRHGYNAVKMGASRILASSNIQCVFTRNKPLNVDCDVFNLY